MRNWERLKQILYSPVLYEGLAVFVAVTGIVNVLWYHLYLTLFTPLYVPISGNLFEAGFTRTVNTVSGLHNYIVAVAVCIGVAQYLRTTKRR